MHQDLLLCQWHDGVEADLGAVCPRASKWKDLDTVERQRIEETMQEVEPLPFC